MNVKKILTTTICLLPISRIKPFLLNALGHKVSYTSKIGFSLILTDQLSLDSEATIKRFNLIKIPRIVLRKKSKIGNFNYIGGDFDIILKNDSIISNLNIISRGQVQWKKPRSKLIIGRKSQITSLSTVDLAASVIIGDDTVLAGKGIQVWSHGFIHDKTRTRNLVVGKVIIGSNVYIGAKTCINPGVTIGDDITIGTGSVVSKDLLEYGLYVSAPLRFLKFDPEIRIQNLTRINVRGQIYYKKDKSKGGSL